MDLLDKKIEILRSAGECFARYGYEKTTLEDIGKPVGLNKASIYYYYKNKESIFTDVIKNESDLFLEKINKKISSVDSLEGKILFYINERFKYLEKTVNLNKLSIEITVKHQAFFNNLLADFFNKEVVAIEGILKNSIDAGEIIQCDTKKVAESILVVCDAIKQKTFNCNDPFYAVKCDYSKIENDVRFIVTLMLDGLKK